MPDEVSEIGVRLTLDASGFKAGITGASDSLNKLQAQAEQAGSGSRGSRAGGGKPTSTGTPMGVDVTLSVSQAEIGRLRKTIQAGLGAIPVTIQPQFQKSGNLSLPNVLGSMLSMQYGTPKHQAVREAGQFLERFVGQTLPQKARGGPVQQGRPVIVGERRPEVFVPRQSGDIVPSVRDYYRHQERARRQEVELAALEFQQQQRQQRQMDDMERRLAQQHRHGGGYAQLGRHGGGRVHMQGGGRVDPRIRQMMARDAIKQSFKERARTWFDYDFSQQYQQELMRGAGSPLPGTGGYGPIRERVGERGLIGSAGASDWAKGFTGMGMPDRPVWDFMEAMPPVPAGEVGDPGEHHLTGTTKTRAQLAEDLLDVTKGVYFPSLGKHFSKNARGGRVKPISYGPGFAHRAGGGLSFPIKMGPSPFAPHAGHHYPQLGWTPGQRAYCAKCGEGITTLLPDSKGGWRLRSDAPEGFWEEVAARNQQREYREASASAKNVSPKMLGPGLKRLGPGRRMGGLTHAMSGKAVFTRPAHELARPDWRDPEHPLFQELRAHLGEYTPSVVSRAQAIGIHLPSPENLSAFDELVGSGRLSASHVGSSVPLGMDAIRATHAYSDFVAMAPHEVLFKLEKMIGHFGQLKDDPVQQAQLLDRIGTMIGLNFQTATPATGAPSELAQALGYSGRGKHAWSGRVAEAYRATLAHGGGTFPVDPSTPVPSHGHALGIGKLTGTGTEMVNRDDPLAFIRAFHKQKRAGAPFVGTWLPEGENQIYVDPSVVLRIKREADMVARFGEEQAMFNLKTFEDEPTSAKKLRATADRIREIVRTRSVKRQGGGGVLVDPSLTARLALNRHRSMGGLAHAMAGNLDVGPIEGNLRKYFNLASTAQHTKGMDWYASWGKQLRDTATQLGFPPEVLTAAAAALSPNNGWPGNFFDAIKYATAAKAGQPMPKASTFGANQLKAWNILTNSDPSFLKGLKVNPFSHALLGDPNATPQDIWMKRAAVDDLLLPRTKGTPSPRQRREMDRVTAMIAAENSIEPRQAQAIIWEVVRDMGMEKIGLSKHMRLSARGGPAYAARGVIHGEPGGEFFHYQPATLASNVFSPTARNIADMESIRRSKVEMAQVFDPYTNALVREVTGDERSVSPGPTLDLITVHSHPGDPSDMGLTYPVRPSSGDLGALFKSGERESMVVTPEQTALLRNPDLYTHRTPYAAAAGQMTGDASLKTYLEAATEALVTIGKMPSRLTHLAGEELPHLPAYGWKNPTPIQNDWLSFFKFIDDPAVMSNNAIWDRVYAAVGEETGAEYMRFPTSAHGTRPHKMPFQMWDRLPHLAGGGFLSSVMQTMTDWAKDPYMAIMAYQAQQAGQSFPGKASGGSADKGLYIVGEIGPELFVPDHMKGMIPKKVMDQIPHARGGMEIIGQRPNSLFAPAEDGIIVPNRLMAQVPHAARGVEIGPGDPRYSEALAALERDKAVRERETAAKLAAARTVGGFPPHLTHEQLLAVAGLGGGGPTPPVDAEAERRAASERNRQRDDEELRAEQLASAERNRARGEANRKRIAANRRAAEGAARGQPRMNVGQDPASMAHNYQQTVASAAAAQGIELPEQVAAIENIRRQARATVRERRRYGESEVPNEMEMQLAQARVARAGQGQLMGGRTAMGAVANVMSFMFGGRQEFTKEQARASLAQVQFKQVSDEVRDTIEHETEAKEGYRQAASEGIITEAKSAEEIEKSDGRIAEARKKGVAATKMLDEAERKALPTTGGALKNLGVIIASTTAYGKVMQLSEMVIEQAVIPAMGKWVDEMQGFSSTSQRVTTALADQTRANGNNFRATLAAAGVTSGMSSATFDWSASILQATVQAKVGAKAYGDFSEIFRASIGAMQGQAPAGLFGGYGGIGGGPLFAEQLGGGKGLVEQLVGDIQAARGRSAGPDIGQVGVSAGLGAATGAVLGFGIPGAVVGGILGGGANLIGQLLDPNKDYGLPAGGVAGEREQYLTANVNAAFGRASMASGEPAYQLAFTGKNAYEGRTDLPTEVQQLGSQGYEIRTAAGVVVTSFSEAAKAAEQLSQGLAIPDINVWFNTVSRQLSAKFQMIDIQGEITRSLLIPNQFMMQRIQSPYPAPGAGVIPGAGLSKKQLASLGITQGTPTDIAGFLQSQGMNPALAATTAQNYADTQQLQKDRETEFAATLKRNKQTILSAPNAVNFIQAGAGRVGTEGAFPGPEPVQVTGQFYGGESGAYGVAPTEAPPPITEPQKLPPPAAAPTATPTPTPAPGGLTGQGVTPLPGAAPGVAGTSRVPGMPQGPTPGDIAAITGYAPPVPGPVTTAAGVGVGVGVPPGTQATSGLGAGVGAGFGAVADATADVTKNNQAAAAEYDRLMTSAQGASGKIRDLQNEIAALNANIRDQNWAETKRLTERGISDLKGVLAGAAGKKGGSLFGNLEGQLYAIGRASQSLDLQLQKREIATATAIAGFAAPGETGEERYMRQKENLAKAAIAKRQLGFAEDAFTINGQIWKIAATRARDDSIIAWKNEKDAFNAQTAIGIDEGKIAVLEDNISKDLAKADSIFQDAIGKGSTALQAIAEYAGTFGGDIKDLSATLVDQNDLLGKSAPGVAAFLQAVGFTFTPNEAGGYTVTPPSAGGTGGGTGAGGEGGTGAGSFTSSVGPSGTNPPSGYGTNPAPGTERGNGGGNNSQTAAASGTGTTEKYGNITTPKGYAERTGPGGAGPFSANQWAPYGYNAGRLSKDQIARMFLAQWGAPSTADNVRAVKIWINAENSHDPNLRNNPLNLHASGRFRIPGLIGVDYVGPRDPDVAVFDTIQHGVAAGANNLFTKHAHYAAAVAAIRKGQAREFLKQLQLSGWQETGYGTRNKAGGQTGATGTLLSAYGTKAAGFFGSVSMPTTMTVGEAGTETVAILRNPRMAMLGGGMGGGGGNTVTVNLNGTVVRDERDIHELARCVAQEVERILGRKGQLLGLRGPSV